MNHYINSARWGQTLDLSWCWADVDADADADADADVKCGNWLILSWTFSTNSKPFFVWKEKKSFVVGQHKICS